MNFTIDVQAIATTELHSHLESQVQEIAPEIVDPIAAKLRSLNRWRVKEECDSLVTESR